MTQGWISYSHNRAVGNERKSSRRMWIKIVFCMYLKLSFGDSKLGLFAFRVTSNVIDVHLILRIPEIIGWNIYFISHFNINYINLIFKNMECWFFHIRCEPRILLISNSIFFTNELKSNFLEAAIPHRLTHPNTLYSFCMYTVTNAWRKKHITPNVGALEWCDKQCWMINNIS